MAEKSQGAIHLSLGLAASRIKQVKVLRYCPKCLTAQLEQYGEYFWYRQSQVYGADACLEHGIVFKESFLQPSYYRHQYFAAAPDNCNEQTSHDSDSYEKTVSGQVTALLNRPPTASASFSQWSCFYKNLAAQNDCARGKHINYENIVQRVTDNWLSKWLDRHGLIVSSTQTCWLRSIFRKHRKSFSYLEHIVVLDSFLPHPWCICEVLDKVSKIQDDQKQGDLSEIISPTTKQTGSSHREHWLMHLKRYGIKAGRINGGGSAYAWLYRHDKQWLLNVNKQYRKTPKNINQRIDWHSRDIAAVRQLIRIRIKYDEQLESPRYTRRWFMSKMDCRSQVEKNIKKLPLVGLFFKRFCEDVADYQIRRITHAVTQLKTQGEDFKRWRVLRTSGLADVRLKNRTRRYLDSFGEE